MKLTRKVLYRPARFCGFESPQKNFFLAQQMLSFMRANGGIGLAASQIGISKRIFVIDINGDVMQCFNPKIVWTNQDQSQSLEGCLSFPNEQTPVRRPESVAVEYQDHQGVWQQKQLSGLVARCFQHELDHLDGITMFDRAGQHHAI